MLLKHCCWKALKCNQFDNFQPSVPCSTPSYLNERRVEWTISTTKPLPVNSLTPSERCVPSCTRLVPYSWEQIYPNHTLPSFPSPVVVITNHISLPFGFDTDQAHIHTHLHFTSDWRQQWHWLKESNVPFTNRLQHPLTKLTEVSSSVAYGFFVFFFTSNPTRAKERSKVCPIFPPLTQSKKARVVNFWNW